MIDCISGGRLECGMVRGVPFEIFPANTNPTLTNDRLWEGIDLVAAAWTRRGAPFNYEGRFWHKRSVNIWPRPIQQPRPRIWITGTNGHENIKRVAREGHAFATFLTPWTNAKLVFDMYREHYVSNGLPGGLAFMPLVFVADSEAEALSGMQELEWLLRLKDAPQYRNPPGYSSLDLNVQALRGAFTGRSDAMRAKGLEYLREMGVVMYGTPDRVVAQIRTFYERVGGFDHLLVMLQSGFLDHARTVRNMTLFAKEVYPAVRGLPWSMFAPGGARPL